MGTLKEKWKKAVMEEKRWTIQLKYLKLRFTKTHSPTCDQVVIWYIWDKKREKAETKHIEDEFNASWLWAHGWAEVSAKTNVTLESISE